MGRDGREVWEKRVGRWRESGLTAKEFAAETGLNANTLAHWGWQLGGGRRGGRGKGRKEGGRGDGRGRVGWVEVVSPVSAPSAQRGQRGGSAASPRPVRATAPSQLPFELVVGARTVRIPSGFDADELRRLLTVVEGD